MTTITKVKSFDDEKSDVSGDDDEEVLSSTRIKQRRATVIESPMPTAYIPRYLRSSHGNIKTRRQSMPAQHINQQQPLPSIRLTLEAPDCVDAIIDKSSEENHQNNAKVLPTKTPVTCCRSFPLDYRLKSRENSPKFSRFSYNSHEKINSSSEKINIFSEGFNEELSISAEGLSTHPSLVISQIGLDNKGHHTSELELTIASRTPSPQIPDHSLQPSTPTDKIRRHSIAVSNFSDSGPLPGMADLAKSERFRNTCKNRDRKISGNIANDLESARHPSIKKTNRFVPKPDNHLFLSIFSCFCCPLIGLFAVIHAVQVDPKYEKGKKDDSVSSSKNAKSLALTAVCVGMMIILGASIYGVIVLAN